MKSKTITLIALQILLVVALFNVASALTIKDVTTNPSEVAPGQTVDLKITIENNLNEDVTGLTVSLNLDSQVVSGLTGSTTIPSAPLSPVKSTEVFIGDLNSDDQDIAKFDLIADADASAGTYKIPVTISYLVDGQTQPTTEKASVSVTINSKPEFVLVSEGLLLQNQKNDVDVKITNIGLTKAKLLNVELAPSTVYQTLSPTNVYLGDLDSNDFDSAKFSIYVKDSSIISLPLTLTYRDSANKPYTEDVVVSARVYSQQEAVQLGLVQRSNTGTYIVVIVVLLVLWIVYRNIKKWSKNRKKRMNDRSR